MINQAEIAIRKFECHPSILEIKGKVTINSPFTFSKVCYTDMIHELKNLNIKKSSTFMNITPKLLKDTMGIIVEPLVNIWNIEIICHRKFPSKLKYADLVPIFKKLDSTQTENYRPVSILPVVSKLFER